MAGQAGYFGDADGNQFSVGDDVTARRRWIVRATLLLTMPIYTAGIYLFAPTPQGYIASYL